jgi:two-component system response regulator FixJ
MTMTKTPQMRCQQGPTVFLVDDDQSLREALVWLLESVKLTIETFASAVDFLEQFDPGRVGCLVLDIRMPGMSGLELQKQLREKGVEIPIIFVTGHGDVPMCVQAFETGAFAFLEKPLNHQKFLDEIHRAIDYDMESHRQRSARGTQSAEALSPREREVMELVVEGKSIKQIAGLLGISIQTCSKHRSRILEKMHVGNDVELVRLLLADNR